jgi:hypothetical protein
MCESGLAWGSIFSLVGRQPESSACLASGPPASLIDILRLFLWFPAMISPTCSETDFRRVGVKCALAAAVQSRGVISCECLYKSAEFLVDVSSKDSTPNMKFLGAVLVLLPPPETSGHMVILVTL